MYCKHCGNEIPNSSEFCKYCKKQVSTRNEISKRNAIALALIAFAALCVFLIILIRGGFFESSDLPIPEQTGTENSSGQTEEKQWIPEGMYKVGTDIPEGEYFVWATSYFCSVQVSSDSSGSLSSIVMSDMCDTFMFVTAKSGQYLDVSGGSFVSANIAPVPEIQEDGTYKPGMYRVGIDIPAGEYKVTATGDFCSIHVTEDASGLLSSYVNTEYVDGQAYVTVIDGQYLSVSDGVFAPVK